MAFVTAQLKGDTSHPESHIHNFTELLTINQGTSKAPGIWVEFEQFASQATAVQRVCLALVKIRLTTTSKQCGDGRGTSNGRETWNGQETSTGLLAS
jgi:hypothetical protein